jgi:hypothetical protein
MAAFRAVISAFAKGRAEWFLVFWLVGWALGEATVSFVLLYMVAGAEVITLSPGSLMIRLAAFGVGRTWEYDASQVRRLRVVPNTWNSGNQWYGGVAFDYGARTVRFAHGIDEAEATLVVSDLAKTGFLPQAEVAAQQAY